MALKRTERTKTTRDPVRAGLRPRVREARGSAAGGRGGGRLASYNRVDAGDEQPVGAAFGEKLQGAVDSRRAAGQNNDTFGARVDRRCGAGNALGEIDEADKEEKPDEADEHAQRKACTP